MADDRWRRGCRPFAQEGGDSSRAMRRLRKCAARAVFWPDLCARPGPRGGAAPRLVAETAPNNTHIHGVDTNVPGYEVSWNCYDRLISHEMKTLANGTQYYDRDNFKMELPDDMKGGDMSVTL